MEHLRALFRLDGEDVIRVANRRSVMSNKPDAEGYIPISHMVNGRKRSVKLHRLKFFLKHGWLPPIVDHRNGVVADNSQGNLRSATHRGNSQNRKRHSRNSLPRCVFDHRFKKLAKPYQAQVRVDGKLTHLGYFVTPEEASTVVEAKLRKAHGEFYRPQESAQ